MFELRLWCLCRGGGPSVVNADSICFRVAQHRDHPCCIISGSVSGHEIIFQKTSQARPYPFTNTFLLTSRAQFAMTAAYSAPQVQ